MLQDVLRGGHKTEVGRFVVCIVLSQPTLRPSCKAPEWLPGGSRILQILDKLPKQDGPCVGTRGIRVSSLANFFAFHSLGQGSLEFA